LRTCSATRDWSWSNIDDPTHPTISAVLGEICRPTSVAVQFRYGFVCDHEGVRVLDTTDPGNPRIVSTLKIEEAHSIYLARTYA